MDAGESALTIVDAGVAAATTYIADALPDEAALTTDEKLGDPAMKRRSTRKSLARITGAPVPGALVVTPPPPSSTDEQETPAAATVSSSSTTSRLLLPSSSAAPAGERKSVLNKSSPRPMQSDASDGKASSSGGGMMLLSGEPQPQFSSLAGGSLTGGMLALPKRFLVPFVVLRGKIKIAPRPVALEPTALWCSAEAETRAGRIREITGSDIRRFG